MSGHYTTSLALHPSSFDDHDEDGNEDDEDVDDEEEDERPLHNQPRTPSLFFPL